MAPHADNSPRSAPADAHAPAPAEAAAADTMDITFVCRGYVDMIEDVPRKTKMMKLRPRICAVLRDVLGIEVTPLDLRMWTLKREDGSWAGETELEDVEGHKTALSKTVGSEMKGAPEEGVVHMRIRTAPSAPPPQDQDAGASDFESAAAKFNNGCVKVVGSKRRLSVDDGPDDVESSHTPFSAFTERQVKRMLLHLEPADKSYKHPRTPLPKMLEASIREAYKVLVNGGAAPWMTESEAQKRRYIDAVLAQCIFAVNAGRRSEEQQLELKPEYNITCKALDASGRADWVVTRGPHMLVVIEAKQCDIKNGQYQMMAMMEAIRIMNKKTHDPPLTIKAICTDFQNWLFVERTARHMNQESTGAALPEGKDFSETILPICERVYDMLLNL